MVGNNGRIEAVSSIYVATMPQGKARTNQTQARGRDEFVLSNQGRDFASYLGKLRQMPAVRQEKVDFCRKQIENGTYQVDAQKLAKQIIDNFIFY